MAVKKSNELIVKIKSTRIGVVISVEAFYKKGQMAIPSPGVGMGRFKKEEVDKLSRAK